MVRWLEVQSESTIREMNMKLQMALTTAWWKSEPQREANCALDLTFLNAGTMLMSGFQKKEQRLKILTISPCIYCAMLLEAIIESC